VNLSTSYFLPATLGGDHALKAGALYQTGRDDTFNHVGGNTTARFTRGVATSGDLHRDAATAYEVKHWHVFLQDTYTRGRLTGLVGVRFDSQADKGARRLGRRPSVRPRQYAPESAGSGIGAVFTNARWLVKVSGMYSLPFGVNVSAFYNARQGCP